MVFGQSLFQSVLTRLDEENRQEEEDERQAAFRVAGLNSGFVADLDAALRTPETSAHDAYRDSIDTAQGYDPYAATREPESPQKSPPESSRETPDTETATFSDLSDSDDLPADPPPQSDHQRLAHLARLDPQEIAEDLALDANETSTSLADKRRLFARRNHPDSVPEDFRAAANTRMKIANRLIDEALRRLPRQSVGPAP